MPDKCPNCGGNLVLTGKTYGGYPSEECDGCNTGSLIPVEGLEPPFRMIARKLHERGIEIGRDVYDLEGE